MTVTIKVRSDGTYVVGIDNLHRVITTVTDDAEMVDDWFASILRIHRRRLHVLCVGLDIEWRPNFGGGDNPVAVIQICVGSRCLIFQILHADDIPDSLRDFLLDYRFRFFGVGIQGDVNKLVRDWDLDVQNADDLRYLAEEVMNDRQVRQMGLKGLASRVMGIDVHKPKKVQTSRWDSEYLSHAQIKYACVDAFLSFEIGRRLTKDYF